MMAYYPEFRADPNSVPKINGLPGIFENIQKGALMAQLPEKIRNERTQMQLATQKAQMENKYYPQLQEATIGELQGRSNLYQAQGNAAMIDAQQKMALLNALQNSSAPLQSQTTPQPTAQQSQIPQDSYFLLDNLINKASSPKQNGSYYNTPSVSQVTQSPTQNVQSSNYTPGAVVVNQGNPDRYNLDNILDNHPEFGKQLEQFGIKKTIDNKIDNDGRVVSTVTYPSGRVIAMSSNVGPSQQDRAMMQELGKLNAQAYNDYSDVLDATVGISMYVSNMRQMLDDPDFKNSVGPMNSAFSKLGHADPRVQKLTGSMQAFSGEVQAAKAASLKLGNSAAATKLGFVAGIKPSEKDTYYSLLGKMEALNTINKWNQDFSNFMANAILEGVPRNKAILEAEKAIPSNKYSGEIDRQIEQGQIAGKLKSQGLMVNRTADGMFMVAIPSPEGTKHIPVDKYDIWLKDLQKENGGKK